MSSREYLQYLADGRRYFFSVRGDKAVLVSIREQTEWVLVFVLSLANFACFNTRVILLNN